MGHVPEDTKWYLADLVEEFRIEGEPGSVVHVNSVLIKAESPQEAYAAAMSFGGHEDDHYLNSDGKPVTALFRGLRDLNAIKGELEHGTEVMWEERVGLSEAEIAKLIRPQPELAVFAPIVTDGA